MKLIHFVNGSALCYCYVMLEGDLGLKNKAFTSLTLPHTCDIVSLSLFSRYCYLLSNTRRQSSFIEHESDDHRVFPFCQTLASGYQPAMKFYSEVIVRPLCMHAMHRCGLHLQT